MKKNEIIQEASEVSLGVGVGAIGLAVFLAIIGITVTPIAFVGLVIFLIMLAKG